MVVGQDGTYLLLLRFAAALPSPLARIKWEEEEEDRRVTRSERARRRRTRNRGGGGGGRFEEDIVNGWKQCDFEDFTTACPLCSHRFVPRFKVSCDSSTFEGSQGPGTPLYCEFLSPWALRKELGYIIGNSKSLHQILDPSWRSGNDVRATIWWNLIAMFKRHQLPFSFLLQGSFRNRLIHPVPQDQ